jgi:hypothetical protein
MQACKHCKHASIAKRQVARAGREARVKRREAKGKRQEARCEHAKRQACKVVRGERQEQQEQEATGDYKKRQEEAFCHRRCLNCASVEGKAFRSAGNEITATCVVREICGVQLRLTNEKGKQATKNASNAKRIL